MILQPIEQLSLPIKWKKKWEGMAKSLILKDGDWLFFVQSNIEALIASRDTEKPLNIIVKEGSNETEMRYPIHMTIYLTNPIN